MRLEWLRDALRLTGYSPRTLSHLRKIEGRDWDRWLRVVPADLVRTSAKLPSMGGRWEVDAEAVCFVPRFPFVDGTSYTVLFDATLDDQPVLDSHDFDLEDLSSLTITRGQRDRDRVARVVDIFPTATELPRNQLKLYIEFSDRMSEGHAATHVHAQLALTGEPVDGAFLAMEPELWDPDRRRLTVLFDPARIKRGLAPHEESGYPLQEGTAVEIIVNDGFRDAMGRPLILGYSKRYEVGPDIRALVDPSAWSLAVPTSGTVDPVVVSFDRPLDAALLEHCLRVVDADGHRVDGVVCLPPGEQAWELRPDSEWTDARYTVVVDAILEDLAGNSVARVFDRDLSDPAHTPVATDPVALEFNPVRTLGRGS